MKKLLVVGALLLGGVVLLQSLVEANKPWWLRDATGPSMPAWLRDLLGLRSPTAPQPYPIPLPVPRRPAPAPCPGPNCPNPKPKRWGPQPVAAIGTTIAVNGRVESSRFTVGGPVLDGVEVACDLPSDRHQKNTGGSDGAGLCVFTSVGMMADWCSEAGFVGFRDWMKRYPGGGHPRKLKEMITRLAEERGVTEPPYLQVTNGDTAILEEANEHRIMLAVTYAGRDGVYYRGPVPHMVNLVAYNRKANRAAILDNNYPGQLLWMSCDDFVERWKEGGGGGWAVAFLRPPPPPVPVNQQPIQESIMIGQCPTCPPPAYVAPAAALPATASSIAGWEWRRGDPRHGQLDLWGLYQNGNQVGVYQTSRDLYYTLASGTLTENATPPVPVPVSAWPPAGTHRGAGQPIFGVDLDKIRNGPAYEVNGRAVTRDQLIGAIHDQRILPAVKGKPWVVVAGGTEQQRAAVLADLDALPERGRVVVKSYAAGEWPLAVGLQAAGSPSIQFLGPENDAGQAVDLGRFDAHPGRETLATAVVEAVRKADPTYQPQARRPTGGDVDPTTLAVIVAAAIAILVFPRRRR